MLDVGIGHVLTVGVLKLEIRVKTHIFSGTLRGRVESCRNVSIAWATDMAVGEFSTRDGWCMSEAGEVGQGRLITTRSHHWCDTYTLNINHA